MAQLIGGIGISHAPSMGRAYDDGMRSGWEPRWRDWYDGLQPVRDWLADVAPDRLVIVYNDHLNHFDFAALPTFAIGIAEEFPQADEGWGLRPFPSLPGDTVLAVHLTESLVHSGFDLTVCQQLTLDHGVYSWFPYLLAEPWTAGIVPIAVNMVRQPLPTHRRLRDLGTGIGDAIRSMPTEDRVLVIATGGMSHQISGARFGMTNETFDRWFLEHLGSDLEMLVATPQAEFMRVGGTEAAELGIWFTMRAALPGAVNEVYRYNAIPAMTGCGVIVFEA